MNGRFDDDGAVRLDYRPLHAHTLHVFAAAATRIRWPLEVNTPHGEASNDQNCYNDGCRDVQFIRFLFSRPGDGGGCHPLAPAYRTASAAAMFRFGHWIDLR